MDAPELVLRAPQNLPTPSYSLLPGSARAPASHCSLDTSDTDVSRALLVAMLPLTAEQRNLFGDTSHNGVIIL